MRVRGGDVPSARDRLDRSPRRRDGAPIRLRSVRASDEPSLLRFLESLSQDSRRLRFFSLASDVHAAAHWAAGADGIDHIGLLALDRADRIVGHAAACRVSGPRAEVAVEVGEDCRHQGLATILITELARRAERVGIHSFVAEVLPENREMLAVFHDGFDGRERRELGEVDVAFPTSAWRLVSARLAAAPPRPCPTCTFVRSVAAAAPPS